MMRESLDLGVAARPGTRFRDENDRAAGREVLERAVEGLSEGHRQLILRRDFLGHTWEEIAEAMAAGRAGVARRMYAEARARLTVAVLRRMRHA